MYFVTNCVKIGYMVPKTSFFNYYEQQFVQIFLCRYIIIKVYIPNINNCY